MASSQALRQAGRQAIWAFVLLGASLAAAAPAAAYSILHNFAGSPSDRAYPNASLILDGAGNLYGTTYAGGPAGQGTVLKMRTDGTGFTLLHSFAGSPSDGANPSASLLLDGAGNLYGTTVNGGASGYGTVFTMKTDGTGFTLLHSFAGGAADGVQPHASLILDGAGNLYGTTVGGGAPGYGSVFTMKTDGTGFTLLHSFAGTPSDGAYPEASLILDGAGNLYGTTGGGGSVGGGTVFTVKADGTGFTLLHSFVGTPSDGSLPFDSLLLDGAGNLYGTTADGGPPHHGTVFKMKTDGTGFTLMHSFAGFPSDGEFPYASLILDGAGNLYGTTGGGGSGGFGTVFTLPVPPPAVTVSIDIQPGSFPNMIDLAKKRQISVAILTTATFDAASVDPATVRFGASGTEAAPVDSVLQVVDRAGHTRLLLGFLTQETGIACGDTSASLSGKTVSEQAIQGSDAIQTVGCP